jgi:sugar phosphate isomerase/epimerase
MNPITFSTLACPGWQMETIIAKASEFGYNGIEWRGGSLGHIQPNMPTAKKNELKQRCAEAELIVLAVTAYTSFVSSSAKERQANVDELRHYADLATEIGAQYVRTFLGELPSGIYPDDAMYERIADCLNIAAEHALSVGVRIAIEPHDDFACSSIVVPVFKQSQFHPALRVIWDIGNAFAVGEDPSEGFDLLNNRIAYIQVKDGKGRVPDWQLCSLGKGDVPLGKAFELLLANDYQGALSVEWEYAWHPELDPPEIALPAALRTVQELLAAAQPEST